MSLKGTDGLRSIGKLTEVGLGRQVLLNLRCLVLVAPQVKADMSKVIRNTFL